MTKVVQEHKYVAIYGNRRFMLYGQHATFDGAVKKLCRQLRRVGVPEKFATEFMVYTIARENVVMRDETGVYEVQDGMIVGLAVPAHWVKECDVRKPLTTLRQSHWREGFADGGAALTALLTAELAARQAAADKER